jgi:hypothetical protein
LRTAKSRVLNLTAEYPDMENSNNNFQRVVDSEHLKLVDFFKISEHLLLTENTHVGAVLFINSKSCDFFTSPKVALHSSPAVQLKSWCMVHGSYVSN